MQVSKEMGLIRKDGFTFCFDPDVCTRCPGRCCRGKSGNIWINDQELKELSRFLEINTVDFINRFVDRVDNRSSLKERYVDGSYDCIFFDARKNGCSVYAARPNQCRRFPFWDEYKNRPDEILLECPGIQEEPEHRKR